MDKIYNDIINLYNNSNKNFTAFLYKLKQDKYLLNEFDLIKKQTCYFLNIRNVNIQTLYNILNNIKNFPTYKDGGIKIFKNFNEGYYSEKVYNTNKLSTYINFIRDEKYIYPALKHLGCGHQKYFKNPLIVQVLKKLFKENYEYIPKKHIFTYAKLEIYKPLYCKVCGKLLKYPNISLEHCNNTICKETYNLKSDEYFDFLYKTFNIKTTKRRGFILSSILKKNKNIHDVVYNKLLQHFDIKTIDNMTANQKLYHFLYNINEIPMCKNCGKKQVQFNEDLRIYKSTCRKNM